MNRTIIFDTLNNDGGEIKAVLGANEFLKQNPNYKIILVGNEKTIQEHLLKDVVKQVEIVHQEQLVHKSSSLRDVIRNESSMLTAFDLLKEDKADAILSSGDSGSFVSLAALKIPRLAGVSRPAFMPIIPTVTNNNILLLDAGANIDIKSEYLLEWANVAVEYAKVLQSNNKIRVGILNIGVEEYKGTETLKNSYALFNENSSENFEFIGFVEPNDVINNKVDIVLSDGFNGNIFLKTMESTFLGIGHLLKQMIHSSCISKIGGFLLRKKLKKFKNRFDYRNIGGAYVIGLKKIVVKAHGGSDERAFLGALNQVKNAIESSIIDKINIEGDYE
ncbi:glycerol-3-phosphate acyltransferase PlsX [Metamycoplasma cloacale]|uniref:Phosphate acyltransferase n=1 Tax=Metamycoplasma cloacale TaxID=92401 RepID=A0A2Z4LLK9_9BACT|nr:phosphate acyltransferase PlsX [Metamycoplasma cloacale]AWX42554.1 phosphate acyltransferase PlsX [Metamycoplasma cloacale]VEU79762.1 glycerol-3-phosphate acyltransferase PlsX [Metamycoplasma cloacale]